LHRACCKQHAHLLFSLDAAVTACVLPTRCRRCWQQVAAGGGSSDGMPARQQIADGTPQQVHCRQLIVPLSVTQLEAQ
jgi:hypothetical protein